MRLLLETLVAVTLLSLCGCVSNYQTRSESAAELIVHRGMVNLGAKSGQEYTAFRDASCPTSGGSGRLAYMLTYTANQKTVKVDASGPIYLLASTSLFSTEPSQTPGAMIDLVEGYCSNFVSFLPLLNHKYDVKQDGSPKSCKLTIVDQATGLPPPDIRILDAKACVTSWRTKS